jgi:hypothetical protein
MRITRYPLKVHFQFIRNQYVGFKNGFMLMNKGFLVVQKVSVDKLSLAGE